MPRPASGDDRREMKASPGWRGWRESFWPLRPSFFADGFLPAASAGNQSLLHSISQVITIEHVALADRRFVDRSVRSGIRYEAESSEFPTAAQILNSPLPLAHFAFSADSTPQRVAS